MNRDNEMERDNEIRDSEINFYNNSNREINRIRERR